MVSAGWPAKPVIAEQALTRTIGRSDRFIFGVKHARKRKPKMNLSLQAGQRCAYRSSGVMEGYVQALRACNLSARYVLWDADRRAAAVTRPDRIQVCHPAAAI